MAISLSARAARSPRRRRALLSALAIAVSLAACSEPSGRDPKAERGRQLYLAQCIACHNSDPAVAGVLGPPVKGSPRELLESKVLKGTYPAGYAPKRPTALMPAQPALEPEIGNLAAFLK
jgi:mono/diheme cytochrome c family protein